MLSTSTWSDFKNLVQAQVGSSLSATEESRLQALANLAASRAYRAHKFWPRFLVAGEPRTLLRNYIAFSEDSFYVYGSGTEGIDGLYKLNGTANTKARYSKYQGDGTSIDWDIEYDGSANWELLVGADNKTFTTADVVYYTIASTADLPPTSGWSTSTGTAPAPLLVDVADIDTFYDVQVNGFQLSGTGGWSADRLVSSKGCYVEVGNSDVDEVYVTYKAAHTSRYGDGTGGTTADIPDEWFEYMALYTARQMQIANRQGNGSPYAVIASREVEAVLEDEMMKIEEQGIVDNLGRRIETGILNSTMLS